MSITSNKKAYHEYHILEKFEAGIELLGSEVKAIRTGKANLLGAYVRIEENQAILYNCDIATYNTNIADQHAPKRPRKLLMHKKEIQYLNEETRIAGKALIPLEIYWKNNHIKLRIATAKGKNQQDKRQALKQKTIQKELKQFKT